MKNNVEEILTRGNNNFDLLRILAASVVIIYHSFALNPSWGIGDPTKSLLTFVTTGGLAVKLFFFISGLLVANSLLKNKSVTSFVVSRSLRILPALFFVVFISAFFIGPIISKMSIADYFSDGMAYSYVYDNMVFDAKYFLPGIAFSNGYGFNGSIWTIKYEVLCYVTLLTAFILQAARSKSVSTLLCLIVIFEPLTPLKGCLFAGSENNAIYLLAPCFCLGVLLAIYKDRFKPKLIFPLFLFITSFFFRGQENVFSWLVCIGFCLLMLQLSVANWFIKLKPKDDVSYGIYLWGFPVQQIFSEHFSLSPFPGILLPLLVAFIIAKISWTYVESPCIRLSKKILNSLYQNPAKSN